MSKKCMIERERKRERLSKKYSQKREQILERIKKADNLEDLYKNQKDLQRLPGNSLPIRRRNRCWKTGRPQGFYRDFGLSRHVLREMAHQCLVPGVTKSSW
nr:ribosomal protein S14 [Meringosphaera mediterranea]